MATQVYLLPTQFSDGCSREWPKDGHNFDPTDQLYHQKLASLYFKDDKARFEKENPRVKWVPTLKALPNGYQVYTKPRGPGGIADRYLYGHHNGRFNSPNQFYPHFSWLMNDGQGVCECARCSSTTRSKPPNSHVNNATMAAEIAAPHLPPGYVVQSHDEWLEEQRTHLLHHMENVDGEKSIINRYFQILENDKVNRVDIAYDPKLSPLDPSLRSLTTESQHEQIDFTAIPHSFEPRIGEVVLFLPNTEPAVVFHETSQTYRTRRDEGEEHFGFPTWLAGVVVQLPLGPLAVNRLKPPKNPDDFQMLIMVEMLTVRGARDNEVASHSIPLHRLRPFSMFRELLNGLPQNIWHRSIKQAMDAAAGVSHCAIYRFSGVFPDGKFSCRGLWIGNEMFCRGDAARLLPFSYKESVREVLIIHDIYLMMTQEGGQLHAEYILEGQTYSLEPFITPHQEIPLRLEAEHLSYPQTFDIDLGYGELNDPFELPTCLRGYSFELSKRFAIVRPEHILGRLYERDAMDAMINSCSLDVGLEGVCEARKSMALKQSMVTGASPVADLQMVWTRDRIQMLGVKTFGNYDFSQRTKISTPVELSLRKLSLQENDEAESDEEVDGDAGLRAAGKGDDYGMETASDEDAPGPSSKRPRIS